MFERELYAASGRLERVWICFWRGARNDRGVAEAVMGEETHGQWALERFQRELGGDEKRGHSILAKKRQAAI